MRNLSVLISKSLNMYMLLIILCLLLTNFPSNDGLTFSSNHLISRKSGNIQLQGIFPNSLRFNSSTEECNRYSMANIQLTQAMIYAIDKLVNDNPTLLPGLKLGWTIIDSCSSRELAVTSLTANVILSLVDSFPQFICEPSADLSNNMTAGNNYINDTSSSPTIGIIAEKTELVTLSTAAYTSSLQIPQISYFSFNKLLTDRKLYPYFYRTSSPHHLQVQVLIDISTKFNWNWGSVVVAGSETIDTILPTLRTVGEIERQICVNYIATLYDNYTHGDLQKVVRNLKQLHRSRIIGLIGDEAIIYHLLEEAEVQNLTGMTFIGSYGWLNSPRIRRINPDVIGGAIGIDLQGDSLIDFAKYIFRLDLCNNNANPWFMRVLYEKLESLGLNPDDFITNCTLPEFLKFQYADSFYSISYISAFVMDAVLAFAHAFHNNLGCNASYCPPIDFEKFSHQEFNHFLSNVTFKGISSQNFVFRPDGSSKLSFNVINLQPHKTNTSKVNEAVVIGFWNDEQGAIINTDKIVWNGGKPWYDIPSSRCADDCQPGYYQVMSDNLLLRSCCWSCHRCESLSVSNETNQRECTKCYNFTQSNPNRTQCIDLEVVTFKWNRGFAFVYIVLASLAVISMVTAWVIIIIKRKTPIIKASNFTLLILILIFMTISIPASTFLLLPVTAEKCLWAFLFLGTGQCGILLTVICKCNQIALIFKNSINRSQFRSKLLKTQNQVIGIIIFLFIYNGILVGLSFYKPVTVLKVKVSAHQMELQCKIIGEPIFIATTTIMLTLCVITLAMAYRARSIPDNFSEAKYIFICSLILACVSITGMPAFLATSGILHRIVGSIACLLFGLVPLLCIMGPKIYVIFCQPQLNTQEQTITSVANFSFANSNIRPRSPLPPESTDSYLTGSPIAIGRKVITSKASNRTSSLVSKGITNPDFIENDKL